MALGVSVHAAATLPMLLLATMAVSIKDDLGFNDATIGMLIATVFGTGALAAPPAGRLCERLGARSSLRLAVIGSSGSMVGIAAVGHSLASLFPFVIVGGLALGLAQPATDMWLSQGVAHGRQGTAFALKQAAAGPGAGLLAGLAVPVAETSIGWRGSIGFGSLLAALTILSFGRGRNRVWAGDRRRSRAAGLPMRSLVLLGIAGGVATLPQTGFIAFAVSGAVEAGLANGTAGALFAAASVTGVIVRLLAGRLVDRRNFSPLLVVAGMLGVSTLGFLLFMTEQSAAVFIAMPLLAATVWGFHGLFFHAVAAANPLAPARASSIVSVGVLIGAVVGPLAFGAIAERSYRVAWGCALVWAMVGMAAIVGARRLLREETSIDGGALVALTGIRPPRQME